MTDPAVRDALSVSTALAQRIQRELDVWQRREGGMASRAARALARLATAIASKMAARADVLRLDLDAGNLSLDDVASLNERARLAEELHAVLDHSSQKTLHPVLRPTVEYELNELGISAIVLVCGTRETLYEIEDFSLDDPSPLLPDEPQRAESEPLLVFRVPNVPLDWPPHHVLLYHEVGHAVIRRRLEDLPSPEVPEEYNPTLTTDAKEKAERFQKLAQYDSAAQRWFEEFFADAVGALLAGPAYLFAFCRFLGSFASLEIAFETHPPMGLRLRFIREILDGDGLIDESGAVARNLSDAWALLDPTTYKSEELHQDVAAQLLKTAFKAHPSIVSLARDRVGERCMTRSRVKANVDRGKLLRENGIPPIDEGGGPLLPADIFGSVWAAFLEDPHVEIHAESLAKRSDYYARVLLASLDGVEAMRAWREP